MRQRWQTRHWVVLSICLLVIAGIVAGGYIYRSFQNKPLLGVWWWNDELDEQYLDFAQNHQVTEIYYCSSRFNETTENFIKAANQRHIKVYWLTGDYHYINDVTKLQQNIQRYQNYQATHQYQFAGIHCDIEPHQNPEFKTKRQQLITDFVALTYQLRAQYPDLWLEYDLPFWLEDTITYQGQTKPAYAHIIDQANRVTLMSYRDTAQAIYDCGKDELAYAQTVGKPLNFGVETHSTEGDKVSFQEEGTTMMYQEIKALRNMLPYNCGIVIHQIMTWYDLKD